MKYIYCLAKTKKKRQGVFDFLKKNFFKSLSIQGNGNGWIKDEDIYINI